jgi:hypothetical protein
MLDEDTLNRCLDDDEKLLFKIVCKFVDNKKIPCSSHFPQRTYLRIGGLGLLVSQKTCNQSRKVGDYVIPHPIRQRQQQLRTFQFPSISPRYYSCAACSLLRLSLQMGMLSF